MKSKAGSSWPRPGKKKPADLILGPRRRPRYVGGALPRKRPFSGVGEKSSAPFSLLGFLPNFFLARISLQQNDRRAKTTESQTGRRSEARFGANAGARR